MINGICSISSGVTVGRDFTDETLIPREGTFLGRDEAEAIIAKIVAGRFPVETDDRSTGNVPSFHQSCVYSLKDANMMRARLCLARPWKVAR